MALGIVLIIVGLGFISKYDAFIGGNTYVLIGLVLVSIGAVKVLRIAAPTVLQARGRKQEMLRFAEQAELEASQQRMTAAEEQARQTRERKEAAERDKTFQLENSRAVDDAAAHKLRTSLNELINYAGMLSSGADRGNIVQVMNETVGQIAGLRASKAMLEDEIIQFDTGLLLKSLRNAGLEHEILYERVAKVMQYRLEGEPTRLVASNDITVKH